MDNLKNKNLFGNLKILSLGLVSLLALIVDWMLISTALYGSKPLVFWLWPAAVSALVIALLTLYGLVNSSRIYAGGFALITLLAYTAIFPKHWLVIGAGLLFVGLMFWFEQRIRSEETSRQDFSIRRVSSAGISVIIYAFLLLLGLNIYYNTAADFKANPDSYYQALGRSTARSARYLSGSEGGRLDLNQTLDQYLETETRKQVPNYDSIPQSYKQQYLEETKQQFFRQFNIQLPGDKPLSEVVAQFAVERVKTSAEKYQMLFPLIFTIIIFALMRTFSFLLRWTALLLTWSLYKILLSLRFFRLSKVMVEVNKLEI